MILKLVAGALLVTVGALAVTNSLTITEKAGVTTANYPVQFGRPFLSGEIATLPQALVNGVAVPTQADVKQRYTDGSVKYAIISFLIPTLQARATVTITFQNQLAADNAPLTTEQMLDPARNFEASMELTPPGCAACETKVVSARRMLSTGAFSYWTSGPIATTVILADHFTKSFDIGWKNIKTTKVSATLSPNTTTLSVDDASGWTAPMLLRVNNPSTTDTHNGTSAEDLNICAINTDVKPNQLTIGMPGSCPSISGRSTKAMKWLAGAAVYPNLWTEAPNDNYRSFRPIMHATFWPAANKIRVRFIGEIADTDKLQDQIYSLALKLGYGDATTVYTNAQIVHRATTRWTREFWLGGRPSPIEIDHNLEYLAATKFIYNFDTTKKIKFPIIQSLYNAWINSGRDLYENATMLKGMGAPGMSDHTGYYTGWNVWWLYTMDYRAWQMAHESADLGAAWLFHLREGTPGKKITRSVPKGCKYLCDQPGIGHIMSVTNRSSLSTRNFRRTDRRQGDSPTLVGSISNGGWSLGMNHGWDAHTPLYVVTGDFWYLEEAWFWAGWGSAYSLGPTSVSREYMRGPTGAEGVLPAEECRWNGTRWVSNASWQEVRTSAWILRSVVNTAFMSPDNSAEKSYLETLAVDAIAGLEGSHDIHPSVSAPWYQTIWDWANNTQYNACGISPLHMHSRGAPDFVQSGPYYGVNNATTAEAGPFGNYYMMFAIFRAAELGYPATAIAKWEAQFFVDLVTQPASNPYLLQMGRMPTVKARDYGWIDNWTDYKNGYLPEWANVNNFNGAWVYQLEGMVAVGNAHQLTQSATSQRAWTFVKAHLLDAMNFSDNPTNVRYAIVPRISDGQVSSCDINSDGTVNVSDVQVSTNAALRRTDCSRSDITGDGNCNVTDVMRVVNAALGEDCRTGL